MKYEFHIGDYVETIGGFIGWVDRMRDDGYIWVANKDIASCSYHMPEQLKCFTRIGQYDFTKKDEGKIEFIDGVDTTNPTDNSFIIDKINELIEAVNELRGEYESD